MSAITLGQVVRNSIEAEKAAARFYRLLADSTVDAAANDFLLSMERLEAGHAESIERLGQRLGAGDLPQRAEDNVELIETAPAWRDTNDITVSEALDLAYELEQHAELYYGALAEATAGEVHTFFSKIAEDEKKHVQMLEAHRPRR